MGTPETPEFKSGSEIEGFIENAGSEIGEKAKELLRQLHEGHITPDEIIEKLKQHIDAAIVTVVESQ